ncbi:DUF4129 domain-containing protein [Gillisia sp. M10.2A]|uniref:DUF4129 domain-containing protein n=1 Tax=Gillisia lutea TaxID=2909668 RepID=A0ABS9EG26_9FLAO|nr:DUF4129 domain-containing protein [Gillisia lutea]MCF4101839.1 DUF4129 domain-containing protein [Gillisia lutea]
MNKRLLLILLFSIAFLPLKAQDSIAITPNELLYDKNSKLQPVHFSEENIEIHKNEEAFNYLNEIENDSWWTRFKRWLQLQYNKIIAWLFGDYQANDFIKLLVTILPFIIIGAILGLIIWLFIRLNPGASFFKETASADVILNEEEQLVHSENISQLIQEAITAGNLRLAIRYYYLQLIRTLNKKAEIKYEFQKTNSEYLQEIKHLNSKEQIKKAMRIYDFIWYGNFPISENHFHQAQLHFEQLERTLKSLPNE